MPILYTNMLLLEIQLVKKNKKKNSNFTELCYYDAKGAIKKKMINQQMKKKKKFIVYSGQIFV